jgi:Iron-sulfur cluster-binding domain
MSDTGSKSPIPEGMTRECFDPWNYVEFRANGDVAPCCFRPAIGNVRDANLSEILNGAAVRRLRSELLYGPMDYFCAGCRGKKLIAAELLRAEVAKRVQAVRLPPGFDPELYLAANPDVADAGLDAAQHFLHYGRLEARPLRPSALDGEHVISFDPELYLQANPDIARLGLDPFEHFQRYGQYEGRPLRPPADDGTRASARYVTPAAAPASSADPPDSATGA